MKIWQQVKGNVLRQADDYEIAGKQAYKADLTVHLISSHLAKQKLLKAHALPGHMRIGMAAWRSCWGSLSPVLSVRAEVGCGY